MSKEAIHEAQRQIPLITIGLLYRNRTRRTAVIRSLEGIGIRNIFDVDINYQGTPKDIYIIESDCTDRDFSSLFIHRLKKRDGIKRHSGFVIDLSNQDKSTTMKVGELDFDTLLPEMLSLNATKDTIVKVMACSILIRNEIALGRNALEVYEREFMVERTDLSPITINHVLEMLRIEGAEKQFKALALTQPEDKLRAVNAVHLAELVVKTNPKKAKNLLDASSSRMRYHSRVHDGMKVISQIEGDKSQEVFHMIESQHYASATSQSKLLETVGHILSIEQHDEKLCQLKAYLAKQIRNIPVNNDTVTYITQCMKAIIHRFSDHGVVLEKVGGEAITQYKRRLPFSQRQKMELAYVACAAYVNAACGKHFKAKIILKRHHEKVSSSGNRVNVTVAQIIFMSYALIGDTDEAGQLGMQLASSSNEQNSFLQEAFRLKKDNDYTRRALIARKQAFTEQVTTKYPMSTGINRAQSKNYVITQQGNHLNRYYRNWTRYRNYPIHNKRVSFA